MSKKSTQPWILALYVLVSFIIASHSVQSVADHVGNSDMISIDCGASTDYVDETTGISYQTDQDFIETGINNGISPDLKHQFDKTYKGQRQLERLRSFPEGDRNCYTLKPKEQQHFNNNEYNYIIRAVFAYSNYDNKNQPPSFDLYFGPNFWSTVRLPNGSFCQYYEIIHVPIDIIQVCLVNTGQGTPFISALEFRPLNRSLYSISLPLFLQARFDIGTGLAPALTRYQDDVYDRLWFFYDFDTTYYLLNTSVKIRAQDSTYKLPSEILSTAAQSPNSSVLLSMNWTSDSSYQYYVFLHFAEIQKLPTHHRRIINVTFDDINFLSQPLEYLKPVTISSKNTSNNGNVRFTVRAAAESDAPPILNAFEIYRYIPMPNSPTNAQDVNAVMEIKRTYGISRISWQGDPCIPSNLRWEGLNCSSDNNSRIISLNLSSSKLTGQIATSFANLKNLESLYLSNNKLIGQLPEFFADLPNLKVLNLTGNKLTGSIPKALKEKAGLQLSVASNPGLCQKDSCKEHKFVIPLVASIAALVLIIILSLMIWRLRKKRQVLSTKSQKMGILKQKNQEFSYSQVLRITDNFKTIIGEGGFGKVYLGTLGDDTQVAVKLLSPSSKQGYKEFESEAQLLMVIHHRNLVSLVGYCQENDMKALIYEYMDNGDLGRLLSEKNPNVLKWNERLQVATDAAKGLEYLHNGCKTPIIHRDLKPSNILLNKSKLAKIADFGLSRAFIDEGDSHLTTQPAGTPGYIDPEFQRSGNLNKKSDIYSFGMILLQLITGHPPIIKKGLENIIFILDWVQPKIDCGNIEGIVDPRLSGEYGVTSAWKAVEVAMSCILPTPTQRPEISYVLQELQQCLASEMDQARMNNTRDSINYTVNYDSMTIPSAR